MSEIEFFKEGYVYILINASLQKNTLKIGMTRRTPEIRAEEMSEETGLPAEYMVAYKRKVSDCEEVEALIHERLKRYRISHSRYDRSREFFVIPLEKAISVLNELADQFKPEISKFNGGIYEGKVKDNERPENGHGIYTFPDGSTYEGEWKDGKEHGQGTWTLPDGSKSVGEWKDGLPNGQVTWTFPDGGKYVGEYKDGKRHGKGTEIHPGGKKHEGEWKDGEYIG